MKRLRWALCAVAIHGCGAPQPPQAAVRCSERDGAAAAAVIDDLYAAFRTDDAVAARQLFAPDFVAFDGGKRLDGPGLIALVKKAHDDGKQIVWNVAPPRIQTSCDIAWLVWENRGSITDASGTTDIVWNESAVLRWTDRGWRLALFHSSRAVADKPVPIETK